MALVVYGMKCAFCGKALEKGQEIIAFPPFVGNELDPLWIFNDGAFHSACFYSHPLAEKAEARLNELQNRIGPGRRACVVCGKQIIDPDDYFAVGHLVEDSPNPLFWFNYTQAHRSCLPKWSEARHLYDLLKTLEESGKWQGKSLDTPLTDLRNAISH